MSSDIPRARSLLVIALAKRDWKFVHAALKLMRRASPVRKAPAKRQRITDKQKQKVRALKHSKMTYHDIAIKFGIANGGRVSEIMTGKRK